MARLQLALNVDDLDAAIDFYSRMFATEPARRRPGYANFAIDNPPLKLVLNEKAGPDGSINHLGVEVETKQEVSEAEVRLAAEGLDTTGVAETICCYAEKTETWLTAPDGNRWEWYVRTGDAEQMHNTILAATEPGKAAEALESCDCGPVAAPDPVVESATGCCPAPAVGAATGAAPDGPTCC